MGYMAVDLPPGDYVLNLVATSQDGSEVRQARALSELRVTDQLPLGHTLIKGVDLWNGALTMSHQDFTVPGRGPDLDFSRSYSSSAARWAWAGVTIGSASSASRRAAKR